MNNNDHIQIRLAALEAKARLASRVLGTSIGLALLGVSTIVAAQNYKLVPEGFNVFEAGEPAIAAEVNENFSMVLDGISMAAPTGTIVAFGGNSPPAGWLICDGEEVAQEDFPALAAVIGVSWGAADPGNIKLPDLRNYFLRGATQENPVGQEQGFAMQNLQGSLRGLYVNTHNALPTGVFRWSRSDGAAVSGGNADAMVDVELDLEGAGVEVAEETRPMNKAVHYIIKY